MIVKTEYEDGKPAREIVFPVLYEKRGNYHYLNGKRVCRNLVIEANLCGLVKFY